MNIDSLRQTIADSVLMEIQNEESFYKTILTEQHETYELIVYIWIAITAILISGTLFWNFFLSNKRIKSEVQDVEKNLFKILEENFEKLSKQNEKFKSDIKVQIENEIEVLNKENREKIENKFIENKKEIETKFKKLDAESHRSFALIAEDAKRFWTAASQYCGAMAWYNETKQTEMVNRCLVGMIRCLEEDTCKEQYITQKDNEMRKVFVGLVSKLPGYLEDKKDIATELLNSFEE